MLLRYLSKLLSDDGSRGSTVLVEEQMCRWCAAIVDAHYTELILADQAELLVELHENIIQQVVR